MWHKSKKDLFSYYSKKRVNGVMGVNGIMRIGHKYRIRPNYHTVCLGFSKLLENTCGKICICLLKATLKKDQQRTY